MLYKHIIQVENLNVGLKVCVCEGGGGHTHHCPPIKKVGGGGAHAPLAPTPCFLRQCDYESRNGILVSEKMPLKKIEIIINK